MDKVTLNQAPRQPKVTKATMRRSCAFCRSRKIKCTGQSKCDACKERSIDCVYGREASKGRPRGSGSKSPGNGGRGFHLNSTRHHGCRPNPEVFSANCPFGPSGSPPSSIKECPVGFSDPSSSSVCSSIARELEQMFERYFMRGGTRRSMHDEHPSSEWGHDISGSPPAFARKVPHTSSMACRGTPMIYGASVPQLTQGLVEMLAVKLGVLGCYSLVADGGSGNICNASLAKDSTRAMFDSTQTMHNSLVDFDDHCTLQMIDVWFSFHPLSPILSKTLLLREYRSGHHEEVLLLSMLADAVSYHGSMDADAKSEKLFQHACSRLASRPVHECNISTVQALVIMGWRELCLARVRRATCFLSYSCQIISELSTSMAETPNSGMSRINGIDVGKVEAEMLTSLYWVTYSMTLWTSIQLDRPFKAVTPPDRSFGLPPIDEQASIVVKLDIVSGNVSTLQAQSRMIRGMWPLGKTASTVGMVYAEFSGNSTNCQSPEIQDWNSMTARQRDRFDGCQSTEASLLVRIRQILASAADSLPAESANSPSHSYTLITYHALLIHLLFPSPECGFDGDMMTSTAIDALCMSMQALASIFRQEEGRSIAAAGSLSHQSSHITDIFTFALDACGRAMEHMLILAEQSHAPYQQMLFLRSRELISLATELQTISRSDALTSARRLRVVKKKLKAVRAGLEQLSSPHLERVSSLSSISTGASHPASSFSDLSIASHAVAAADDLALRTPISVPDLFERQQQQQHHHHLYRQDFPSPELAAHHRPASISCSPVTFLPTADMASATSVYDHDPLSMMQQQQQQQGGGFDLQSSMAPGLTTAGPDKEMAHFANVHDLNFLHRDLGITFSFN
ncbi:MAG: hypothetical protein M1825_006160 [Sarcosagium campestre]|nr:MAG: hypothetical protein M1825_006160 [Sarcosagium campestre]